MYKFVFFKKGHYSWGILFKVFHFILLFCLLRIYQEQSFIQDSRVWLTKSVEPKPPKLPFYAGAATASHQEQ
jgi:hypothetical protein